MMYKPDDENLEPSVEETAVLSENDINEPDAPIEQPPESPEDPPVQENE